MRTKVQLQLSTNFAWRVSAHHRGMHNNTKAHSLCKISADLCCFLKDHWLDEPLVSQTQTRKWFGRSLAALTLPAPSRATDWFNFNVGHWLGLRCPSRGRAKPPLGHGGYRPFTFNDFNVCYYFKASNNNSQLYKKGTI